MKLAAFVLTTLLTPILAQAQDCHSQSDNASTLACLNKYGHSLLTENAPLGVRDRYEAELAQVLSSAGIQGVDINKTTSLAQAFLISVPIIKDPLDTSDAGCFAFDAGSIKKLTKGNKEYQVTAIQKQMREAAYFLKTAHAWALGNTSSHLFQIREVQICGESKSSAAFARGVLRINVAFKLTGAQIYTAKDLLSLWNDGTLVFGDEMGFVREKISGIKGDIPAVLKNKIRPAWIVLNPLGDIRYQLRMAFFKKTGQTLEQWRQESSAANALAKKSQELGLEPATFTEAEAREALGNFQNIAADSGFLNQALEQLLIGVNGGSHSVTVTDNRVNIGLIAVKNNKQISVNVAHLFPTPLKISEELKEAQEASADQVNAQLSGKNIGLVAIDLFDQVAVNVVPPNIIPLLEKLALKEALTRTKASSTLSIKLKSY